MLPVTILKDLTEQIIHDFYKQHPVESTRFDYKRELGDLRNETYKKSFLRDVTAFSNTQGGDLIIGIDETSGVIGIEESDINGRILQIETIIRENTDPPVSGVQIKYTSLSTGKHILVIRIPKSYGLPHRVSKIGTDFYARGEAGNYPIKMPQLRNLFIASNEVSKSINQFIGERITSILTNDTFFELDLSKGVFVLHVIPVQSFEDEFMISHLKMSDNKDLLVPIAHRGGYLQDVNNFDGLNRYSTNGRSVEAYAQVFNSGVIECVNTWLLSVESQWGLYLHSDSLARGLFSGLDALIKYMQAVEMSFPFVLHLELHGLKNIKLSTDYDNINMFLSQASLRSDSLRFPSILLTEELDNLHSGYFVKKMKVWLDLLWRAFGYSSCGSYNEKGYQFRNKTDGFWPFEP